MTAAINAFLGSVADHQGELDNAGNWSLGHVPLAGEIMWLANVSAALTSGLDLSAVALAGVVIEQSFTGYCPANTYLKLNTPTLSIGESFAMGGAMPAGSGRLLVDLGATECVVTVHNAGLNSLDAYQPPLRLLANHADTQIHIRRGRVGIAANAPGETSEIDLLNVSFVDSVLTDAQVLLGPGVTIAQIVKTGGNVVLQSPCATITQANGSLDLAGAAGFTTLWLNGGTVWERCTGTKGAIHAVGGFLDHSRSTIPRTVADLYLDGSAASGCQITVDESVVTYTNKHGATGTRIIMVRAA